MFIRPVRPGDAERIAEIYRYYVDETAVTYEETAPDTAEIAERIRLITKKYPYFVAEEEGTVIGYAYASVFKDRESYRYSVETSIYLDSEKRGRGTGTLLYDALEKALREIGIKNMYACLAYTKKNDEYLTDQSEIFHKINGFSVIGKFSKCALKFGRWYDMIWMEKFISEHE